MKIKLLSVIAFALLAVGCAHKPIIKYEYIEKKVPVIAVPAPPAVERPVYETSKLTSEDRKHLGTVAHAAVTEIKQKDGYILILESIINKYKELSEKSEIKVEPLVLPETN